MTNPNDGAPLTRRQLREMAAAQAAAQAAGQGPTPTGEGPTPQEAPAAPVAQAAPQVPAPARPATPDRPATQPMRTRSNPTPVTPSEGFAPPGPGAGAQTPLASRRSAVPGLVQDDADTAAAPRSPRPSGASGPAAPPSPTRPAGAAGQAGVPSRRSLREQTASHRVVVVPPAQSSAIRTVDETGELSAVLDLGPGGPATSERPQPARAVGSPPGPQRQSLQQRTVRPAPAQAAPAQAPAQQTPWSPGPAITPAAARPSSVMPQRPASGAGAPVGQPAAAAAGMLPAAWPAADTPWTPQEGMRPATPLTDAGSATFHQRVTAPGFEPVPALQLPDVHVPATEVAGAVPRWEAITTPSPAQVRPTGAAFDDDDDIDDDDEPDHKYTWLHYLILVAVAFVLGLIIWKVGLEDRGAASPADSAASVGVVFDAPSTPYHHDL